MRDSINYNLNYFIVKTSGTKPMKNTMRKPSPLKFDSVIAASLATKEGKASYEASRPKGTTKPVEGKPSSKPAAPRGPLARAKAKAAVSSRTTKQSPLKLGFHVIDKMVRDNEKRFEDSVDRMRNSQSSGADRNEAKKAAYLKGKKSATTETASEAKARQEKVKADRAGSKTDRAAAAKAKMDKYKSGSKSTTSTETSTKEVAPKSNPAPKPASKTETSVKSTTPSPTSVKSSAETSTKVPPMQMRKPGMKKKC